MACRLQAQARYPAPVSDSALLEGWADCQSTKERWSILIRCTTLPKAATMATVSQRKLRVLRVTGLSRELPNGDLKTVVQEALNDNFTHDERSQIKAEVAIVPSCYESDT